jgi:hypothetical protein
MTSTKRRRLYIEAGRPLPGDLVTFSPLAGMFATTQGGKPVDMSLGNASYGMVIGLDEFLERAIVLVHRQGRTHLGWVRVEKLMPCP